MNKRHQREHAQILAELRALRQLLADDEAGPPDPQAAGPPEPATCHPPPSGPNATAPPEHLHDVIESLVREWLPRLEQALRHRLIAELSKTD